MLAGIAAAALAASPGATAGPIGDAWPYPDMSLGGTPQTNLSDLTPHLFGLGREGDLEYSDFDGDEFRYATHANLFTLPVIPFVYTYVHNHQEVFESVVPSPTAGVMIDRSDLLDSFGGQWSIHHTTIYDPDNGFGDTFSFRDFQNTLIIDDVGIKDEFSWLTSHWTLFEYEWPGTDAAEALATGVG